jgi:NAD(P)-dependent dehydrogenase (short-subunit alcohol dehydrogenase family)
MKIIPQPVAIVTGARMGEISDIVDAVLYLQNATFVTGENIRVDGGVHAGR